MAIDDSDDQSPKDKKTPGRFSGPGLVLPLLILAIIAGYMYVLGSSPRKISYKLFVDQLKDKNVAEVNLFKGFAIGKFREPVAADSEKPTPKSSTETPPSSEKSDGKAKSATTKPEQKPDLRFSVVLPERFSESADFDLVKSSGADYDVSPQLDPTLWIFGIGMAATIGVFVLFWMWLRRQQNQMMGGGFLSGFGKSPARRYEGSRQATTFKDVAGIESVKADLLEIVEFLKNPKKFQKLGGRVPKG